VRSSRAGHMLAARHDQGDRDERGSDAQGPQREAFAAPDRRSRSTARLALSATVWLGSLISGVRRGIASGSPKEAMMSQSVARISASGSFRYGYSSGGRAGPISSRELRLRLPSVRAG